MKKETLKSIVFLLIVFAAFVVSLVFIWQQEYEFSRQLRANVFQEMIFEDIISEAEGQVDKIALFHCVEDSFDIFEDKWNQECAKEGLEDRCSLPKDVAEFLKAEFEQLKEDCLNEYSAK